MVARASKSRFKARALEYFREVEATGEPLVITDHGKPTLEIRRVPSGERDPRDILRGTVLRYDDPLGPVGIEDWEMLQ